jgi:ATP-binding cassette subfamily B protein
VDTETETLIHAALERLRTGRTTFIIAHRIQTVMQADKILVLDKGGIVQQGSHTELTAQEGIYRRIYHLQAQVGQDVESANGRGSESAAQELGELVGPVSSNGRTGRVSVNQ